jgi:hypothetical protein
MSDIGKIVAAAPLMAKAAVRRDSLKDFLAGDSHGEVLLHGLYDDVLQEPVPEELARLLEVPDEPK